MVNVYELNARGFAWADLRLLPSSWPGPGSGPSSPIRDVLHPETTEWLRALARSADLLAVASLALGRPAFAVRGNLFVKGPDSNWSVPWHQDRVVCVRRPAEVAGFSGWTRKAGLHHASAPLSVLRDMVAVRLYLDDSPAEGGPLEVVPGTHERLLAEEDLQRLSARAMVLAARAGSILLLRPLLVHRSRSQTAAHPRRVLHVEYAAESLPGELEWYYAAAPGREREQPL
jgi:ectoine hydroxylase-related dioxygenase (phytanoyl-CoA dioxygenase family)